MTVSLLLCHGNKYYGIKGLDKENIITVDADPRTEPDFQIDISKYKCEGCHIFDRVYIMYCPLSFGQNKYYHTDDAEYGKSRFISIIENIVKGSLKQGGILYTPMYLRDQTEVGKFDKIMRRLGFSYFPYSAEHPQPKSTKKDVLGRKLEKNYKHPFRIIELRAYIMNI